MTENLFQFEVGKPACPIACKYCHVTELDADRTRNWSKGLLGINKACTFVNVPPWINEDDTSSEKFKNIPWHLLSGEFVGWTAITDGLMPSLTPYFWQWVGSASPYAKLLTVVSKWPITNDNMRQLAEIPNFFLVVTITGAGKIENVPSRILVKNLEKAKECGVKALPMVHPYISGVSDLSFLSHLQQIGYNEICVKGLRYNPETMGNWMPESSKPLYEGKGVEETLPEDGWRQKVADSGLSLISPKQWYLREGGDKSKKITRHEAAANVDLLLPHCQVASSSQWEEVRESAIARRCL